ncbi:zinc-dependent alcohol dehydrogenase family protein [Novosphingobium pituita]|uniref:zinc-dependent alcohol dehydrogenase family protein n=1 Tax=Novosphingobium pituita TaxID=3056842 RepID=UPI00295E4C94|nr:zinc-dependent alcohol dehydrogenase family protein [Novosphingobium sp. IK01]
MTSTATVMQLDRVGQPLRRAQRPLPEPGKGEVRLRVLACGICRTDLHVIDGEVQANLPIVPGHEIVGLVDARGEDVEGLEIGQRIGVPWLGRTCGACPYCHGGRENLCDHPTFTGATRDGGFATHVIADAAFCLPIPEEFDDVSAAPLLCAGLIGYRSLAMAGEGRKIGLYGFGASAHIIAQVARWQGRELYAFTRPGDVRSQEFARSLGCAWAGGSDEPSPVELDAAIIFAAVGALVPAALKAVHKGGRVVCAGIHMSDIPSFPYDDLWGERAIMSVANLTREDGRDFMAIAGKAGIRITTTAFPLEQANEAIAMLRRGELDGAAVLVPDQTTRACNTFAP